MLVTAVMMMDKVDDSKVNWFEWLTLRGGNSLYAGWLTTATILGASIVLQEYGVSDATLPFGLTEQGITIFMMWTAYLVYYKVSYKMRNPLYGSVLIWAMLAIRSEIMNGSNSEYTGVSDNATAIAILQTASMTLLGTYIWTKEYYDLSGTRSGILYGGI